MGFIFNLNDESTLLIGEYEMLANFSLACQWGYGDTEELKAHKDFEAVLVTALIQASEYFEGVIERRDGDKAELDRYGALILENLQGVPVISFTPIATEGRYSPVEGGIALLRGTLDPTTSVEDMRRIITWVLGSV